MASPEYKWILVGLCLLMCEHVLGVCEIDASLRKNCGFEGITEGQCKARGCCWDSSVGGAPWCFHARYQGYGCGFRANKYISMSCPQKNDPPEAKYVRIENATYGAYRNLQCWYSCCKPDSSDCEQAVSDWYDRDFDAIVSKCNMTETACTVDAIGSNHVWKCPSPYVSHFQVVYYSCVLADGSTPPPPANLALGRPTWQRTRYKYDFKADRWMGLPGLAVDGNVNPNFNGLSCTHTSRGYAPWWAVDLGRSYRILRVGIKNRADCCANRLRDFDIGVSNFNPGTIHPSQYKSSHYKTCARYRPAMGPGEYRSFDCNDQGRYVTVQLSAYDYLTLCEVEVFGHAPQSENAKLMDHSSPTSSQDIPMESDLESGYSAFGLGIIATLTLVGIGFMVLGAVVGVYLWKIKKDKSNGSPIVPDSVDTTASQSDVNVQE